MITADSKKIVLCSTDGFTKYAMVTAIANKDAEMVADAIYKEWFSKFSIPAQIHTKVTAPVTIIQLPPHHLSCYMGKKPDYHHFRTRTYTSCTTAKHWQL
jgi:hypothetical protein